MKNFGKAVRLKLNEAGWAFLLRDKGDHDIWTRPEGKRIVAPVRIKSRHTANGILKDAGLPKAFSALLAVAERRKGAVAVKSPPRPTSPSSALIPYPSPEREKGARSALLCICKRVFEPLSVRFMHDEELKRYVEEISRLEER